ncbi:predicted protein [Sclerotinia sclerotiorum 1980 UF-70]|uniref:Uncharacterized protein n=1 Tax=Sclerotinia sclerotiorum (strain ATCC 18683 / 1980 / Ss-1) TaxID=665079 RepID=A7EMT7_SCLS1|nr:predicted protein [Sclerotinia sclerotiorum 1980 UF-70]EDO04153.1 predicted protein [Sclerotinia sclerotiorum 1980 UF-70]
MFRVFAELDIEVSTTVMFMPVDTMSLRCAFVMQHCIEGALIVRFFQDPVDRLSIDGDLCIFKQIVEEVSGDGERSLHL